MIKLRCSRWCGFGCTEAAYQKANRDAKALVCKLGKGWKPRVWENLGWHYAAESTSVNLAIHPVKKAGYYNIFIEGGRWVEHGATPKACVMKALALVKREASLMKQLYTALKEAT